MNDRLKYIDLVKGLGILTIVFVHYEAGVIPGPLNTFLGSYMITLFFVVSGWLMALDTKYYTIRKFCLKRCRTLAYPYLVWSVLILTFDAVLCLIHYYDSYLMAREIYKTCILRGIGTLWFLPALFFGTLLWEFVKGKKLVIIVASLMVCIIYRYFYGQVFSHYSRLLEAPFRTLNNAVGAYIAIAVGYYVCHCFLKFRMILHRTTMAMTGIVLCAFAFFCANHLNCMIGMNSNIFWYYFAPLIGPIGFILLFYALENYSIFNWLAYWGRNSLTLMVTHYSFILVVATIILEKFCGKSMEGLSSIICFILSMPIQYGISEWINRKAPYLLKPCCK